MLLDRGPGPECVCLGSAVVCVFLTLCRKNFTTQRPSDYEDTCIKAGDGKTRKGLAQKKQQESLDWAALLHWEIREMGLWGQV